MRRCVRPCVPRTKRSIDASGSSGGVAAGQWEDQVVSEADTPKDSGKSEPSGDRASAPQLEEASFTAHIVSLSSMGMVHLGVIPDPESRQCRINLPLAQHVIDVLRMLRDKTKGNLDEQEERLLADLLYRLQLRYVEARRELERSGGQQPSQCAEAPAEERDDAPAQPGEASETTGNDDNE